jgi:hypothetical protein
LSRKCASVGNSLSFSRHQEIADLDLLGERRELRQVGVEDHRAAIFEALLEALELIPGPSPARGRREIRESLTRLSH